MPEEVFTMEIPKRLFVASRLMKTGPVFFDKFSIAYWDREKEILRTGVLQDNPYHYYWNNYYFARQVKEIFEKQSPEYLTVEDIKNLTITIKSLWLAPCAAWADGLTFGFSRFSNQQRCIIYISFEDNASPFGIEFDSDNKKGGIYISPEVNIDALFAHWHWLKPCLWRIKQSRQVFTGDAWPQNLSWVPPQPQMSIFTIWP